MESMTFRSKKPRNFAERMADISEKVFSFQINNKIKHKLSVKVQKFGNSFFYNNKVENKYNINISILKRGFMCYNIRQLTR